MIVVAFVFAGLFHFSSHHHRNPNPIQSITVGFFLFYRLFFHGLSCRFFVFRNASVSFFFSPLVSASIFYEDRSGSFPREIECFCFVLWLVLCFVYTTYISYAGFMLPRAQVVAYSRHRVFPFVFRRAQKRKKNQRCCVVVIYFDRG